MDFYDAPVSPEKSQTDQSELICGPATPFIGSLVDGDGADEQVYNEVICKIVLPLARLDLEAILGL